MIVPDRGSDLPRTWPTPDGEMARLVRDLDWSATALGDKKAWPTPLRTCVDLMLRAAAPMGIYWGRDHVLLYNDAWRELIGDKHPGALGMPAHKVFPEIWSDIEPLFRQVLSEGHAVEAHEMLLPLDRGSGREEVWFDFTFNPILGDDDTVAGMLNIATESTGRVRPEDLLAESEQRLAAAVAASGAGVYEHRVPIGPELHHSERWAEIVGYSRSELPVGEAFLPWLVEQVHPEDRSTLDRGYNDFLWGRTPGYEVVIRLRHKQGHWVWVRGFSHAVERDDEGRVTHVIGMVTDVTEAKRAEERLRDSERRFRSLVEGIPQLVWQADDGGWGHWCSPQWTAFTGLSVEQSLGEGWLKAVHPEDRDATHEAWQKATVESPFEATHRIWHAEEGAHRWLHSRAVPSRDEVGGVVEWLGTSTDIDELRRLQEEQRVLVAELQHRVRNTLGVIRSIVRRTAEAAKTPEDYAMHLEGRIDAFARVQSAVTRSPLRGVDLKGLVADELLANAAREGEQVRIQGPEVRLKPKAAETFGLAIHELATNAVKFASLSDEAGSVDIDWRLKGNPGDRRLHFEWKEQGRLSAPGEPVRRGFGMEHLERTLSYQLKGTAKQSFEGDGVRWTIELPLSDRNVADVPE